MKFASLLLFLLAGALDERAPRGAVRGGDPHQVHVPDELRQVSHGQADLQIPGKKERNLNILRSSLHGASSELISTRESGHPVSFLASQNKFRIFAILVSTILCLRDSSVT